MYVIRGLLEGNGRLDMDAIAHYYGRWVPSEPIGGMTTSRALRLLGQGRAAADVCIATAERFNCSSQTNGSLARVTPLAVWAHRLRPAQAAKAAQLEAL